ncbi:CotH kinase family protein [Parabacteroides sp. FAFU027]|uniref:CotH kinase family protein n=1 Tax=Parabacteroides sp. FAFU027 TaxID=2922715 RepID=UPI001FB043BA|nr:CotH kinase family protein [Parabacteroides sp. FAFU027]
MKPYLLPMILGLAILFSCSKSNEPVEPDAQTTSLQTDSLLVAQINITTENAAPVNSKETYVNCSITVKSDNKSWNYSGNGKIRGRGNSSWLWYPKKPYRIKLNDKAEMLGLKSEKDWVLLANYRDPTHLMNTFVFTTGQGLGMPFTNHVRYVEVTLNGDYIGLYMFTEQVELGSNRVAIDSNDGVLLSLDADDGPDLSPDAGDNFWSSVYQMPVCVKSPDITSTTQLTTIRTEFAQLETAIKSADYNSVEKVLNIPSFIDYMLIQELVYNVEVDAPRSIYLYKDKDGRWTMGPLWDFDAGFDFDWSTMYTGHNYFTSYTELVLGTDPVNHTKGYAVPSFFTDLFKSKRFVSEYKTRWLAIKDKIMTGYWETTQSYGDAIAGALVRNASRWPIDKNFQTETLHLHQWLSNRVSYMTTVIANYPVGTK